MSKCPTCGHDPSASAKRAARSRWAALTPEQRAKEMSRVRKKGIKRRRKDSQNNEGGRAEGVG
jgi:hypothetical protein